MIKNSLNRNPPQMSTRPPLIPMDEQAPSEDGGLPQGRPPSDAPPLIHETAQPVLLFDVVPALRCPRCGRGMQPRVLRRRKGSEIRECACSLCGQAFLYTPPVISHRP